MWSSIVKSKAFLKNRPPKTKTIEYQSSNALETKKLGTHVDNLGFYKSGITQRIGEEEQPKKVGRTSSSTATSFKKLAMEKEGICGRHRHVAVGSNLAPAPKSEANSSVFWLRKPNLMLSLRGLEFEHNFASKHIVSVA